MKKKESTDHLLWCPVQILVTICVMLFTIDVLLSTNWYCTGLNTKRPQRIMDNSISDAFIDTTFLIDPDLGRHYHAPCLGTYRTIQCLVKLICMFVDCKSTLQHPEKTHGNIQSWTAHFGAQIPCNQVTELLPKPSITFANWLNLYNIINKACLQHLGWTSQKLFMVTKLMQQWPDKTQVRSL